MAAELGHRIALRIHISMRAFYRCAVVLGYKITDRGAMGQGLSLRLGDSHTLRLSSR